MSTRLSRGKHLHQAEVIGTLVDGPVALSQRGRPAAVLVSVEEWDRRARRLKELELLVVAKQRFAEMAQEPSMVAMEGKFDRMFEAKS